MKLYKHISTLKVQTYLIALFFLVFGLIFTTETYFNQNEAINTVQAQELNEDEVGIMSEVTCQCSSAANPFGNEDCTANNWGTTCHTGTEICSLGSSNCCDSSGCDEPEED